MGLGPFTRPLFEQTSIPTNYIEGIDSGEYIWEIRPILPVAVSADLEVAQRIVREKAERKDFEIKISRVEQPAEGEEDWPTDPEDAWVYAAAIPNQLGQQIAAARMYETALARRGTADGVAFAAGRVEDWISAAGESWNALAFEFRIAAEAAARARDDDQPPPVMAVLTLCRHHFELKLKAAIDATGTLPPADHSLADLWKAAEPLMRDAVAEHWDPKERDHCAAVLDEFMRVDPWGTTTRYPTTRDGRPHERPGMVFAFSLERLMTEFARAANFLSLCALWLEIRRRARERRVVRRS